MWKTTVPMSYDEEDETHETNISYLLPRFFLLSFLPLLSGRQRRNPIPNNSLTSRAYKFSTWNIFKVLTLLREARARHLPTWSWPVGQ